MAVPPRIASPRAPPARPAEQLGEDAVAQGKRRPVYVYRTRAMLQSNPTWMVCNRTCLRCRLPAGGEMARDRRGLVRRNRGAVDSHHLGDFGLPEGQSPA